MSDLAMQRLQGLPSFQRWAARTSERLRAEIEAEIEAEVKAEVEARVRAAMEAAAEERARAAEEAAVAGAREVVHNLQSYFTAKGEVPSLGALETMNACTRMTTARYWLNRAYAGESSADIFPDGSDTK